MSVAGSLYSGVSGLSSNARAMSVIGNNIANANTIGFKSSRAIFGDLLSAEVAGSGGASQIGRGTGLSIVDNVFSQGTFENTETNTDLAIEGAGFFIVQDSNSSTGNNYTRAGAFRFDANGNLINPEGYNLMGYALDNNGQTVGDLVPIAVNTNSFTQAQRTEELRINTNLNSNANPITLPTVLDAVGALDETFPGVPEYVALMGDPTDETLWGSLPSADGTGGSGALDRAARDKDDALASDPPNLTVLAQVTDLINSIQTIRDIRANAEALQALLPEAGPGLVAPFTNDVYEDLKAPSLASPEQREAALLQIAQDYKNESNKSEPDQQIQNALIELRADLVKGSFNTHNPTATSSYATSIQVFDSLGDTHLMTTYFTKVGNQAWEWNAVVDSAELAGGKPGTTTVVGSGALYFDENGNLLSEGPFQTNLDALPWKNGAVQTQQVNINMETTQYASPSVVVSQEQNGFGTGSLVKLSIDGEGNVIGNFSNGAPRKLMQIALAKFTNPNALTKIGNNMYVQSTTSGVPVIGTVGSGVGTIFTNALELSNVDLASEFVKMITTQRGFSANSKTITTTDEMLAEVINLKR